MKIPMGKRLAAEFLAHFMTSATFFARSIRRRAWRFPAYPAGD
jgi:hypothetical protein